MTSGLSHLIHTRQRLLADLAAINTQIARHTEPLAVTYLATLLKSGDGMRADYILTMVNQFLSDQGAPALSHISLAHTLTGLGYTRYRLGSGIHYRLAP